MIVPRCVDGRPTVVIHILDNDIVASLHDRLLETDIARDVESTYDPIVTQRDGLYSAI